MYNYDYPPSDSYFENNSYYPNMPDRYNSSGNMTNLPPYRREYPVYNLSRRNSMLKQDIEYLNTLYPNEINELKQLVINECDRMDYKGSMIYDECPDKIMFSKKCNDICSLAGCNCKYAKKCNDKGFLKDIISVMLAEEMFKRRDRRRNYY